MRERGREGEGEGEREGDGDLTYTTSPYGLNVAESVSCVQSRGILWTYTQQSSDEAVVEGRGPLRRTERPSGERIRDQGRGVEEEEEEEEELEEEEGEEEEDEGVGHVSLFRKALAMTAGSCVSDFILLNWPVKRDRGTHPSSLFSISFFKKRSLERLLSPK